MFRRYLLSLRTKSFSVNSTVPKRCFNPFSRKKKVSEETTLELVESTETQYTQDEIERIRDKSRLPDFIKAEFVNKELPELKQVKDYQLKNLRSYYGRLGKASGLNPGLCWPTPEELELKKEYDALAYPPLQEMVKSITKRRKAEANARLKRERDVEENMRKLVKLNQELQERLAKKEAAAEAQRMKKERFVEEIREQLGYNIDIRDPRFRELLEKREEDQKKAAKEAKKKKIKQDRIEYLKQLAGESGLAKEKISTEEDSDDD